MYILLLKWGFGSFIRPFAVYAVPKVPENRRGCADYFKISVEIFAKSSCIFGWDTVCLA